MYRTIILTALISFMMLHSAEAGWMDRLKSKAQNIVDRKVDEAVNEAERSVETSINDAVNGNSEAQPTAQTSPAGKKPAGHPSIGETKFPESVIDTDMDRASGTKIHNDTLITLYGGNTTPWNVASEGSLKVIDTEIKNIRLGMPLVLAQKALKDQGFEWVGYQGQFAKERVETSGGIKEMTPSEVSKIPYGETKKILKRYFVKLQHVPADEAIISELSENKELKALIQKAKNMKTDGKPLRLVTRIEYRQANVQGSKFVRDELMAQFKQMFGEPNYTWNRGSAFGKEYGWLIYHDGAHVPFSEKEELLGQMPDKYRHAFKDGFNHPCGGKDTRNCVTGASVSGAFPDDIDLQLQAARITLAPVMMVEFRSPNITTYLSWEYLGGHKSVRDNYAKKKAREAQPVATMDF